jgi:hypothetical protein
MPSIDFTDSPFQAVPDYGSAHFATHGDPETGTARASLHEQDEAVRSAFVTRTTERQELPPAAYARRLWKALALMGGHLGCFGGIETVSRFRPLARLRRRTLRPPGVAIRARKPWVRKRRVLLG